MVYADHVIPTQPRALARDERFLNENWTCPEGFTLAQLMRAALMARGASRDEARADVDRLWADARTVADAETLQVAS